MKSSHVPELIRTLRRRLRLTQEQLAQRVGVTYSTINHWENGKRVPQPFLAARLRELEAELAEPVSSTDTMPPSRPRERGRSRSASDGTAAVARTVRRRVQKPIAEMVKRIVERFQPDQIILFGSHARGDARRSSDVDLLVVMPVHGSKREAQLGLRRALHDIPAPKDVIVTSPEEFERRRFVVGTVEWSAAREGKRLYGRR